MDRLLERIILIAFTITVSVFVGESLLAQHVDILDALIFTVLVARIFHTFEDIFLNATKVQDKPEQKQGDTPQKEG
jgi:hypothetical protein